MLETFGRAAVSTSLPAERLFATAKKQDQTKAVHVGTCSGALVHRHVLAKRNAAVARLESASLQHRKAIRVTMLDLARSRNPGLTEWEGPLSKAHARNLSHLGENPATENTEQVPDPRLPQAPESRQPPAPGPLPPAASARQGLAAPGPQ